LVLVKWNIDLGAPKDQERATVTTTFITELEPKVDIVFLQDVSKGSCGKFYSTIVTVIRVFRANVMMGKDTITLLTMTRFSSGSEIGKATLGPVCRNKYSNLFERDALCCDILVPSLGESGALTRKQWSHCLAISSSRRNWLYMGGVDGLQQFPPNCLDKTATLELKASSIRVLKLRQLGGSEKSGSLRPESTEDFPSWSDHNGLLCSFSLTDE
ncbi:endonuclease/exonuclease/phosphatase family protein, partial [Penicillium canescens]